MPFSIVAPPLCALCGDMFAIALTPFDVVGASGVPILETVDSHGNAATFFTIRLIPGTALVEIGYRLDDVTCAALFFRRCGKGSSTIH